jgi:hypothetical protein
MIAAAPGLLSPRIGSSLALEAGGAELVAQAPKPRQPSVRSASAVKERWGDLRMVVTLIVFEVILEGLIYLVIYLDLATVSESSETTGVADIDVET